MSTDSFLKLEESCITIGLTCFNAEQTIGRALKSALSQDWPDLEVVVVDDASSDASWEIVEEFSERDSRVKPVRHAVNLGAAAARNTILDSATGSIVAFFDDDDESLPERVRLQYETLREYEKASGTDLVACYASGLRRYPNGYELHMPAIGSRPVVPKGEAVADYLLFNARRAGVFYGSGTPTCALMARLSIFRAVGGFDNTLRRVEDADFAVRLALAGGHVIGCPRQLFLQHATVASDKTPHKNLEAELRLIEKHAGYLKRRNRYGYARDWFHVRYYHFSGQRLKFLAALAAFLLRYPVNGTRHILRTFPSRWVHERDMRARAGGMQ
ncbi:MAG: glycosyltransferase family 2 protein [Nitrospiraceae bacterium]|nr:glycosyltransferase family 2 protein [Nitrospiraceae bacterium]